ncbi:class I SAM-dependent methyltransferase [Cryptosporangium aurantiacum]|uniref:Methyltransferase domain-containing protein n=1 Tax=Cryptosporangium aurantiacum TaxID=134849 RepID=A0A1M7RGJ0_9ACTN|nr:class I SAM-dependent methyltransferase [Cryptosporangium aurantiacum]SHN45281.1 Methyltransferase domain-containing protein [Cryptosporangium aurantiacum]
MNRDEYAESGEFLDLFSREAWQALRGPVLGALNGAAADAGPLVDLGAGSGLGTELLAGVLPEAHIVAVEPSAIQRAALFARLGSEPAVRERVTVVAADAAGVELPDRLGGVLAMNMIGHLRPDDRRALWERIGARLAPGAPLVLNLQPPAEPVELPESVFVSVRVGGRTYQGSGAATPAGAEAVRWRMRYRVRDHADRVVQETTADYQWYVVAPSTLLAELSAAGFEAQIGSLDVVRAVAAG